MLPKTKYSKWPIRFVTSNMSNRCPPEIMKK